MREMKDSGIPWIGEIPKDWKVIPVKYFFNIGRGRVISVLDLVEDGKYPVFSSQTENNGCLGFINTYDYSGPAITWTTDGAKAGTVFFRNGKYNCTNVCGILQIKPKYKKEADLKFFTMAIGVVAEKNKRYDINGFKIMSNEMAALKFTVPPFEQQKLIARFLDSKCAEIDSLTEEIQAQIETLEQYKKSLITETVTKGLDPNVEMKDSGLEWLGMIPSHWDLRPFRYVLKERNEKNIPVKTDERLSLSIDKGITLYAEKTTNLDRYKDDVTQYKLAHVGDFVMNSMNMIVGAFDVSPYFGCVSPAYYTFYDETEDHIKSRFCNYFFKMKPMMKLLFSMGKGIMAIDRGDDRVNTCRLKVSRYDLNKLPICNPPISEQRSIVEYLDRKITDIDSIIEAKKEQLETISQYKKSLIFEYVTGKKEVP